MGKIFSTRLVGLSIILMSCYASSNEDICDRRPLGTKSEPLRPDNQFLLEIDGIIDSKYIPGWRYTVRLRSRDLKSTFIAFTISLKEDTMENKDNPRKPLFLNSGRLEPMPNSTNAKSSNACNNTIIESDVTAKTKVEVFWTAPPKDNKCVSIFAVVAVKPNVWYSFEKPLFKQVCEDPRKSDDMPPDEIDGDCEVCEDARYQLIFEGLWSYNTHSDMFPNTTARFSDIVGASHSPATDVFKFATEASLGLKMLAEQGNTTKFEIETQSKLPTLVRTVLKASSPEQTDMSTTTSFRATREHHRLSIAAGILPSPDWFLGVSNLELCNRESKWANNIRLNLYPIDAGTDKGLDFESSNEEQSPPQPISLALIGKEQKEVTKPFARLLVNRVRTYMTPLCTTEAAVTEAQGGDDEGDNESEGDNEGNGDDDNEDTESDKQEVKIPYIPRTTTTEEPPAVDPDSSDRCPMTDWDEWKQCEGMCVNNTLTGLQIRFRYHMVDGVVVKYIEKGSPVSQYCLDNYEDMESQACEDTCNENAEEEEEEDQDGDAEASRRTWQYNWGRK